MNCLFLLKKAKKSPGSPQDKPHCNFLDTRLTTFCLKCLYINATFYCNFR